MSYKKFSMLAWLLCFQISSFADQILIPAGSVWKYLDNGSNQGIGWRSNTFSDATWVSGAAQLGYGDGDESTVVNSGPSTNKFVTTYFRKTFSIASISNFTSYSMQIKRDDGVVIYVNGTEVFRNNMPVGTIAYNTWASTAVSDDGSTFQTVSLPASSFISGTNVIAVEIHQSNATSSDISFDLSLTGIEGSTSANEVIYMWSGALKPSSAQVVAKLTNASTTCRLVVSTSSSLSNPVLSPAATASSSNNFMAKMTVTGLSPSTTYYYAIQSGGVTDNSSDDIGTFKTPASGAFSFKFTVGSCAVSSNHAAYTLMKNKIPLLHVSTGDFHYVNPNSSTDINVHRLPYEQHMLSQTPSRNLFLSTPLAYVWDDHDFSGNNSNGSAAGKTNARLAYQEYVPHYPLAAGTGNVPIYQSFTIGRVHFILSDLRSERGTTIMSTTQKNWFKNQCLFARDNNLIIAWVSGVSFGGNQIDNWGGFSAERTELSNFFRDNSIRNMFILSGDAHMLAIDNGTNHDFSTGNNNPYDYPVFQAAAVNNSGSTKGGTYSEGGTFPNPSSSTGQYGLVEVTDNGGTSITVKFTGYRTSGNTTSEAVLTSYTFTRTLSAQLRKESVALRTMDEDKKVQLIWDANGAEGNYDIQRSVDGISYSKVAFIDAKDGKFVDEEPASGWNYYQIRSEEQVVQDKIFVSGKVEVKIVPNPVQELASVSISNAETTETSRYILYNTKMKTVSQGNIEIVKGNSDFTLDLSPYPSGEYLLHIVIGGKEVVQKILVVK